MIALTGCKTVKPGSVERTSVETNRPSASDKAWEEEFSPKAVEHRTEAQALYATGWLHELHEENAEAFKKYKQAALLDPANQTLVLEVTGRLLQAKKVDEALEILLKAAEEPTASGLIFARLAGVYSILGKKDSAIDAAHTAIKRSPRLMAGYHLLAQIHHQNEQREEALKVLEEAGSQAGVDASFLVELAEMYVVFGRAATDAKVKPRALDALKRAEKLDTSNLIALQKMADAFALLGESDKASATYAKLLDRYPHLATLRKKLADLYLRQNDLTNAAVQLKQLIQDNPTDPQPYFVLGNLALEARNPKEAIEHFTKVLLLNDDFEPAYYDLAGAQISADQARRALDTLDTARRKFNKTFQTEFYAGLAYNRLKDYSNAVSRLVEAELIGSATATNRLTHVFYFQLGAAYERNKQFEEAEKTFRKVLSLSPNFSEALNYLGYMWAERGMNLAEARKMIEQALKQEPKNAAFLDSLGWVLFKQGKPREALPLIQKSIELEKEPDATLFDHLGDIYSVLKQPDKAREAWQKALSIEATDEVRKKLDNPSVSGSVPR